MPATALTLLGSHLPIHLHSVEADALWLMTLLTLFSMVVIAMVLTWSLVQTFNHNPPAHFMRIWGQLILLWLAPTMPWWGVFILVAMLASIIPFWLGAVLFIIAAIYFYSVCVVPNQLRTRALAIPSHIHTATDAQNNVTCSESKKVIVISNIRLGLFSHPRRLNKLVRKINEIDAECVLVLGEWLYNPPADLVGRLMQIRAINKPIYAIQGAHDNRYVPDNADQFLHEDDLNHAFDALDIIEVNGITQSSNGLTLVAKPTKAENLNKQKLNYCSTQATPLAQHRSMPSIALCNSLPQMQYCLALLQSRDSETAIQSASKNNDVLANGDKLASDLSTLILFPEDSKALRSSQLSEQAMIHNALIQKIPSFGRRGLPFRFQKPSVTVLHLNVK